MTMMMIAMNGWFVRPKERNSCARAFFSSFVTDESNATNDE